MSHLHPEGDRMTTVQKLELRQSEVRQRLGEVLALEGDDRTDAIRVEEKGLQAELQDLEQRSRTAMLLQPDPDPTPTRELGFIEENLDAEASEVARLEARVSLGRYLGKAARGNAPDGAEAELLAAMQLGPEWIPMAALAPPDDTEKRAVTPGPTTHPTRTSFIERVFAGGDAAFLGVMMPSVPAGQRTYNLIAAGPSAEPKAKDASADATAGSFASSSLTPTRIPARYTLRTEELSEDAGLEAAIRADLSGKLTEALDKELIAGAGTVGSFDKGIAMLSDPSNDSAVLAYGASKASAYTAVDGKYAASLRDVRALVGSNTYAKLGAAAPTNDDSMDAASWWEANTGGLRVSAHIAAPASHIQRAVLAKTGARIAAYCPVWQGLQVLRDPFSSAAEGQVHLTANLLAAFKVVDEASYVLRDFKLA